MIINMKFSLYIYPSKFLIRQFQLYSTMSKREKDAILAMGITREEYNQIAGIPTRTRTHSKNEIGLPQMKTDEKKKIGIKKEGYIPPNINMHTSPIVLEFNAFSTFVQELLKSSNQEKSQYMSMQILYQIYKQTNLKGGVVEVSSINGFNSIVRSAVLAAQSPEMEPELTLGLIQKVRQLLFSIQFILRNPSAQKKIYQLGLVNFVDKEELKEHVKDKKWGLEYFNYDLTLFQQGAESIKIDKQVFNLDYMCSHYKKQKIDIRIQNPLDYGFKPSKLKNKKHQMTLGQYRFYQLNFLDPSQMKNFKHSEYLGKGQIFFGVNFQPSDQMLNKEIKKNVQQTFLDYHGDFDMMSFLDTDIPGCSLPQMYFKTPGCWTGGHQENISMSALNINHGPDYSQWYTLDLKYIARLRKELIEEFNTDLYLSQGLWYQRLDWFISRGYPVKRFLQRKDDIVVTGPGTLHWVRSFGVALQTSWNIMPKNYEQFEAAFARHKANKEIRFHKSDTIPLKSLVMKYLNHERTIMKENIRMLCACQLQEWLKQEEGIVDQLEGKIKQVYEFYLRDLQSFCCLCKQEVFVYFLPAPGNMKQGISCLECFKKSQSFKTHFVEELYFKRDIYWVYELIKRCKDNDFNRSCPNQIQQLCKGIHVGKIQGKCSVATKLQHSVFPIKDPIVFNDEQQIKNTERQIFYDNQNLFPLYQNFFKNITESVKHFESQLDTSKDRIRPVSSRSCKMMTSLEEGEMTQKNKQEGINTYISMASAVEASCQTQAKYPQMQQKQIGEVSKSRSREKRKKKQKSKSKKHKKKKSESPRFSSQSQEKKRNSSGSVSSGYKRNNSRGNRDRQKQSSQRSGSNFRDRGNDRGSYKVNDRGNDRNDRNDRGNDRGYGNSYNGSRDRDRNNGDGYRNNNRNFQNNRFGRNQQGGGGNWQDRGNFNRNNNDNDGGFRGGRRDFGDNNDNNGGGGFRGRRDFGDNNGDDRGRGRGRGGRGRGGGGFNNFRSDRNNDGGDFNRNNNADDNRQNDNFGNSQPKCDAPDEY